MKQIIQLAFRVHNLRNAEHFQLHWSIDGFLVLRIPGIVLLATPWTAYHGAMEKEDAVYKRSQKLEETKEINLYDQKRDDAFKFLGKSIDYESRSLDPARKAAAERLTNLHSNYKGADKKALAENTALITNYLQDLDREENQTAVTLLGLAPVVETLRENNLAVEQLYDKRSESVNYLREEGNMQTERAKVDKAFEALVGGINALYTTNEYGAKDPQLRSVLDEIIDGVNARIEQTRLVFSRRTGRKVKGGGGGGNTPGTPDTPDTPPATPPHFEMHEQKLYDDSSVIPGKMARMSAEAVDVAAFAATLNPAAKDGELRMFDGHTWESFPIEAFVIHTDGSPVSGLVMNPPTANAAFTQLSDEEVPAEVVKNDLVLATLGGLKFPEYISEG
jgi:hypothetical protein